MHLSIRWVHDPRHVVKIWHWLDVSFMIFGIFFLSNGSSHQILKPITDKRYGLLNTLLKQLYQVGSEIRCTNLCEIRTKSEGGVEESVFWRKFKMSENLSRCKWAWPIWGGASWPTESRGIFYLFYDLRFKSYRGKRKVEWYSATMRRSDVIIF